MRMLLKLWWLGWLFYLSKSWVIIQASSSDILFILCNIEMPNYSNGIPAITYN